ncbi:MAG: CCA tRNA nucleotidyltransferase [Dysgonamonadaceae bacterium]|jgi:poly(A) polymerase|nr:CCA tRNA nucleotidyltransferase [Dysgonamonadaceae bacterium]
MISEFPEIQKKMQGKVFEILREAADSLGVEAYVIGGYVRDIFLRRESKDIDVVCTGSGIALAEAVRKALGRNAKLSVFKNFGTAHIDCRDLEIEFVGARKESYSRNSRNPIVEDGTLEDDLCRRDFTINTLAVRLNSDGFGSLTDRFGALDDLQTLTIRTPLDPDITFCDDPLRMFRAIRFASQLGFFIESGTFEAIERNVARAGIVSMERITEELNKIVTSPRPSVGFELLEQTGLLDVVLPELTALKGVENREGIGHKDNFSHSLKVLDNLALVSNDLRLRWAALLHDVGKPGSKRFDPKFGWTFHSHEYIGMKMLRGIFTRLKLPLGDNLKYTEMLIGLHMRPISLSDEGVTDSAVRRLLFEAGDGIDDLMLLCEADITSKNSEKVKRFLHNFGVVRTKLKEIEEKDRLRNFRPPVDGLEIMEMFSLPPGRIVGELKTAVKDAVLDGLIPNEYEAARGFLIKLAEEKGLTKTKNS